MRLLVTGTAGFIGYHLARRLLDNGYTVVGFDGMTRYYDTRLKDARTSELSQYAGYRLVVGMLEDADTLSQAADLQTTRSRRSSFIS